VPDQAECRCSRAGRTPARCPGAGPGPEAGGADTGALGAGRHGGAAVNRYRPRQERATVAEVAQWRAWALTAPAAQVAQAVARAAVIRQCEHGYPPDSEVAAEQERQAEIRVLREAARKPAAPGSRVVAGPARFGWRLWRRQVGPWGAPSCPQVEYAWAPAGAPAPEFGWSSRRHAAHRVSDRDRRWPRWLRAAREPVSVTGWRGQTRPTHAEAVAARLRRMRARPLVGARADDGALLGVRVLVVERDGTLVSPQQGTPWGGGAVPTITAQRWTDSDALRGVAGIHACWPRRDGVLPAEAEDYVSSVYCVQVEVRGYGRTVQGATGWRAEHAIVDRVRTAHADADAAIRRRYPGVAVEVTAGAGGVR
jgi:hypothetical protein